MSKSKQRKKIIFSGGGTGGSVTPLLAVASILREKDLSLDLIFVGTKHGPEKKMINSYTIAGESFRFISIPAGKWRRYFSFQNFLDVFKIIYAFFVSLHLLLKEKPDLILSAGGFVSVPLVFAGACFRVPVIVHQQDARAGLANQLMAPCASVITTTFAKSLNDYGSKALFIGNPFPKKPGASYLLEIKEKYNLRDDKPILVISGGGTGSLAINNLVYLSLSKLEPNFQIIHISGKGKSASPKLLDDLRQYKDYKSFELLASSELFALFDLADLVVSRCGLATLTELSSLAKASLLIPMPKSHQEDNALVFSEAGAAIVLEQDSLGVDEFVKVINETYQNNDLKKSLSENISLVIKAGAGERMAQIAIDLMAKKAKL